MEDFGLLGSQFPPGFRFHPTDEELLIHYLRKKVTSSMTAATSIIADIDLYKFNPRDLPDKAFFGEGEWFFFTPRDRKYPNGARPNRAAASGYWKATGTDKPIIAAGGSQCLGVKKALVFYEGRPPKGIKTDWVMHEYRLLDASSPSLWPQKPRGSMRLDDWVLCRVRQKGYAIAGTEEKSENSSLINPSADQSRGKQSDVKVKSNSFYDWGDYQLLSYLLNSEEDGGDSGYRNSYLCSANGYSDLNNTLSSGFAADESQPPQQVASALNSIKQTLSFGVLDEIMLLPPSKRLHFSSDINDQALPTGPVSAE